MSTAVLIVCRILAHAHIAGEDKLYRHTLLLYNNNYYYVILYTVPVVLLLFKKSSSSFLPPTIHVTTKGGNIKLGHREADNGKGNGLLNPSSHKEDLIALLDLKH